MSSQSTPLNNSNMAIVNTERAKTFIWNNRYQKAQYTNGTGDAVTIPVGKLLGKVNASGKVLPLASAAVDGSQYPVGINAEERVVPNGATVELTYCVSGDVAKEKVVLEGADTLATVVDGRTIAERIGADTVGINLVAATEMTDYDNS